MIYNSILDKVHFDNEERSVLERTSTKIYELKDELQNSKIFEIAMTMFLFNTNEAFSQTGSRVVSLSSFNYIDSSDSDGVFRAQLENVCTLFSNVNKKLSEVLVIMPCVSYNGFSNNRINIVAFDNSHKIVQLQNKRVSYSELKELTLNRFSYIQDSEVSETIKSLNGDNNKKVFVIPKLMTRQYIDISIGEYND